MAGEASKSPDSRDMIGTPSQREPQLDGARCRPFRCDRGSSVHETRTRSPTETNEPPRLSARNGTQIDGARVPCSRVHTIGADFDGEAVRFCGSASGTSHWGTGLSLRRVCVKPTLLQTGGALVTVRSRRSIGTGEFTRRCNPSGQRSGDAHVDLRWLLPHKPRVHQAPGSEELR